MINGKEHNKEAYLAINCILPELIGIIERFLEYHDADVLEETTTYYDVIAEACLHLKKKYDGELSQEAELLVPKLFFVYDEMWEKVRSKKYE